MPRLDRHYEIQKLVDAHAPGFSARVAKAIDWKTGEDVAFKVMRRQYMNENELEKGLDVLRRYKIEIRILEKFRDHPVPNRFLDCGFVSDTSGEAPSGGDIESFGVDGQEFIRNSMEFFNRGWRPYIVLEYIDWKYCLLNLVRGSDGNGKHPLRLPTDEGLSLAMQFSEFLKAMHQHNMVYIDHKPEHAYWVDGKLRVIDFNVSNIFEANANPASVVQEKRKDIKYFMAGILFTVFTGRDARYQHESSAPSAAPSDPVGTQRRFDGITSLDFGMEEWLLPSLTQLIQQGMDTTQPMEIGAFIKGLKSCSTLLGWNKHDHEKQHLCEARQKLLEGLDALREAQEKLEQARDCFNSLAGTPDFDQDYYRLYERTTEFLNHKILPYRSKPYQGE